MKCGLPVRDSTTDGVGCRCGNEYRICYLTIMHNKSGNQRAHHLMVAAGPLHVPSLVPPRFSSEANNTTRGKGISNTENQEQHS